MSGEITSRRLCGLVLRGDGCNEHWGEKITSESGGEGEGPEDAGAGLQLKKEVTRGKVREVVNGLYKRYMGGENDILPEEEPLEPPDERLAALSGERLVLRPFPPFYSTPPSKGRAHTAYKPGE